VSNPDLATLMNTPVIIEMDYLNEEQANLMTMFILARVREFVRATRTSNSHLHHAIVLEEAHNIIGKTNGPSGEDQANPKAEATKYVVRFLAEVRALGEGLIIADQLPSALAPEVVKNTNIKLIHRLVSGDDREDIGMTMLLEPSQMEDLARLNPGEAYLFQEGMYKPTRLDEIYIAKTLPILGEAPPDHRELIDILQQDSWWATGVFLEASAIGEALEDLASDMEQGYLQILQETKVAERENTSANSLRSIRMKLNRFRKSIEFRHSEISNREISFFQLMSRRSESCQAVAESKCRPALMEAGKEIWRLWGRLDRLGEELERLERTFSQTGGASYE
jgi:hypothetical protein